MNLLRFEVIALCACACTAGLAVAQAPKAAPCSAPEYRQFDFWIGDWDVFAPDGSKAGENRIESIAERCALLESWTGAKGSSGKSLNLYDATDRKWHQTWVDNTGSRLELVGGLVAGSMVLASTGPAPDRPNITLTQRITWTPNADGTVRQHWQTSEDTGKTWSTVFDGKYVRRRERLRWGWIAEALPQEQQVHAVGTVRAEDDRLLDIAGARGS